MPKMTTEERDAFLAERGILLRIATVSPEQRPLVTPIWYLHREGRILFTPRQHSVWLAHIRQNPNVALAIDDQNYPYKKVVVEGAAEIVHDVGKDDVWRETYRAIAERYVSPEEADAYIQETIDQPRALCAVRLADAKVRTWRMPLEGESYKGIWADRYYTSDAKIRAHEASGELPDPIQPEKD